VYISFFALGPANYFSPVSRWLSEEGLAAMLFLNRPSSRRLLGWITLVTFCVVIFQLLGLTKPVTFEAILTAIPLPAETPASAIPEKIRYKLGSRGLSNESRALIDTYLPSEKPHLPANFHGGYLRGYLCQRPSDPVPRSSKPTSISLSLSSKPISSATFFFSQKAGYGVISVSRTETFRSRTEYPRNIRRRQSRGGLGV
jgi:hypothetical protein